MNNSSNKNSIIYIIVGIAILAIVIFGLVKLLGNNSTNSTSTSTISLAEVQKHNSAGNCYIAVSGKVYNLSTFQHPSRDDFTPLCGMDVTNTQHPGAVAFTSSKVLNQISRYYIGNLGN